jgi:hypothetical protein
MQFFGGEKFLVYVEGALSLITISALTEDGTLQWQRTSQMNCGRAKYYQFFTACKDLECDRSGNLGPIASLHLANGALIPKPAPFLVLSPYPTHKMWKATSIPVHVHIRDFFSPNFVVLKVWLVFPKF